MIYNYGKPNSVPVYPGYFNLTGGYSNYTSGVMHTVRLTGLAPSTRYSYQVGDFSRGKVSSIFSFKTLPNPGFKFPVTFGLFADISLSINSSATAAAVAASKPDLVLLAGDYAYANLYNDQDALDYAVIQSYQYSDSVRWDQLGRMLQPLLSSVPWLGCQGNHERELQVLQGSNFLPWERRFGMHAPWDLTGGSPYYYSANVGPVHVISISPYVPFQSGTDQYAWLQADLANIDRSVTPWVLVTFHAPW